MLLGADLSREMDGGLSESASIIFSSCQHHLLIPLGNRLEMTTFEKRHAWFGALATTRANNVGDVRMKHKNGRKDCHKIWLSAASCKQWKYLRFLLRPDARADTLQGLKVWQPRCVRSIMQSWSVDEHCNFACCCCVWV